MGVRVVTVISAGKLQDVSGPLLPSPGEQDT